MPLYASKGVGVAAADRDAAFAELFRAEYPGLLRIATLLTDASAAEDLVQDAFARTYRRWTRLAEPDNARAYLRVCVANGARSGWRRVRTARAHAPAHDVTAASAEDLAVDREDRREVLRALDALPGRQREVLVLRYYAELSEADIAAALGISAGSVKTHAHRGIEALTRALEVTP